jgi:hypothetical protein
MRNKNAQDSLIHFKPFNPASDFDTKIAAGRVGAFLPEAFRRERLAGGGRYVFRLRSRAPAGRGALGVLTRIAAAGVVLSLMPLPAAHALDPERSIAQYKHKRWTGADGAPSSIYKMIQTRDGFLWLATGDGLFRFDGIAFDRMDSEVDLAAAGVPIRVFEASNGDIWTWYRGSSNFAVYRRGKLRILPQPVTPATVIEFAETRDGAIWAGMGEVGQPLLRYYNGRWERHFPTQSLGLGVLCRACAAAGE